MRKIVEIQKNGELKAFSVEETLCSNKQAHTQIEVPKAYEAYKEATVKQIVVV